LENELVLRNSSRKDQSYIVDADWGQELSSHSPSISPYNSPEEHQPLGGERIELSGVFKTSFRYALRKAWLSALMLLVVCGLLILSEWSAIGEVGGYRGSMVQLAEHLLLVFHSAFLFAEIGFWECYRRRVQFFIHRDRFHVRRGLFRRLESSAPLVGATEFFISQSSCDALLGIYSLLVLTPLSPANGAPRFTRIDGLTRGSADGLLEWLARYVKQQENKPPAEPPIPERARLQRLKTQRRSPLLSEIEH
jgi:hypothetical protein